MQNKLCEVCDKLLKNTEKMDKKSIEKYKLIKEILSVTDCFMQMSVDVAMSILYDLGYTKDEAKKIYVKLTEFKY
ncbi:MAG: hypothetical protein IKC79_01540 [Clostridia bacterium]|nr:hypothetical protein [Clostridia bacterium]